jgi:hypothetical protein
MIGDFEIDWRPMRRLCFARIEGEWSLVAAWKPLKRSPRVEGTPQEIPQDVWKPQQEIVLCLAFGHCH